MDIPVGSGDAAAASTTWGAEYSRGLTSLLSDWQYSHTGITEPRLLEGASTMPTGYLKLTLHLITQW
jgi:hypothetical protein